MSSLEKRLALKKSPHPDLKKGEGRPHRLSIKSLMSRVLLAAGLVELGTLFCRFGLDLHATRDTASTIGLLTGGVRIHHGYIGLILMIASIWLRHRPKAFEWLLIAGLALFVSDAIHHFGVLWLLTGDPEFHLVYPR